MVGIEYSPNSRARCQSCHGSISQCQLRVSVQSSAPWGRGGYGGGGRPSFVTQYHHADCYTGRKDFTKFYGFYSLKVEDQKRFMSEAQRRAKFPEDFVEWADAAEVEKGMEGRGGGGDGDGTGGSQQPPTKKIKIGDGGAAASSATFGALGSGDATADPKAASAKANTNQPLVLTITGLKYAKVRASTGQKVQLVREPENKYDPNAVKVVNMAGQSLGHIKKEQAQKLSPLLAKLEAAGKSVAECTIDSNGDGYTQRLQMIIRKKEPEKKGGKEKEKKPAVAAPVVKVCETKKKPAAPIKASNPYLSSNAATKATGVVLTPPPNASKKPDPENPAVATTVSNAPASIANSKVRTVTPADAGAGDIDSKANKATSPSKLLKLNAITAAAHGTDTELSPLPVKRLVENPYLKNRNSGQ